MLSAFVWVARAKANKEIAWIFMSFDWKAIIEKNRRKEMKNENVTSAALVTDQRIWTGSKAKIREEKIATFLSLKSK